ncbi:restriction endonuclease subunit S [Spirosoma koreense]
MTKTVTLGEIVKVSPESYKPDGKLQYYVGLEHIEKDTGRISALAKEELNNAIKNKFYAGEILYGKLRPYLNKVTLAERNGVCSTDILVLRPSQAVHAQYLLHYMLSDKFVEDMSANVAGANLPRVSTNYILNYPIPLPPLPEQRRIAALLDKADALRQKDRQLLAHYDKLAQSVFLDLFGDFSSFPKKTVADIASKKKYSLSSGPFGSSLTSEHYTKEGIIVLRGMNVTKGNLILKDVKYVSERKAASLERSAVFPDDLVVIAVGNSGFSCRIPHDAPQMIMSQNFNKVTPDKNIINPLYFEYCFNSNHVQKQLQKEITDTVRTFLSLTKIKEVNIPVPPLPLQTHFANVIEQIERQKAVVRQQMAASEALFGRLLQESFG